MKGKIENSGLRDFTVRCLTNRWDNDGQTAEIINRHWTAAADIDEFKSAVLADERLKLTQAYAEVSKETEGHWFRVREMLGDRCIKIISDAGGVKVGSGAFSVCIGNGGSSDGMTRVAVFKKGDSFNDSMMNYTGTSINGTCSIYDYDCGGAPVAALDGNYSVYSYAGLVAFVEY